MAQSSFHSTRWWEPSGPFKILHQINPLRIEWIVKQLGRDLHDLHPLMHLDVLEIGCGGGILSEPLALLGASVTAIDINNVAIDTAQKHLDSHTHRQKMDLSYVCADIMQWQTQKPFHAVILMEILEHIDHPDQVFQHIFPFLHPGGVVVGSTLNRTLLSHIHSIFLAENILRWIPRDTHAWKQFIIPQEMEQWVKNKGYIDFSTQGFSFNPKKSPPWTLVPSTKVNYFFQCNRPCHSFGPIS